jgi:hypothetical protein
MALGQIRPPRALVGRLIGSAIKPKVVGNDEQLRRNSPRVVCPKSVYRIFRCSICIAEVTGRVVGYPEVGHLTRHSELL